MPQTVDCWDLDGTILHTGRLFAPVIKRVAEVSGKPLKTVADSLGQVSRVTFTFQAWFADLGIASAEWAALETELRADLAARAPACVYPGVPELLRARKQAGVRMVLITAGDPDYQTWKFGLLGLEDVFDLEDRHFVSLSSSKADVIDGYLALGPVNFIDDRINWLEEVRGKHTPVHCIRPRWPETSSATPHADDDRLWQTATTLEQLQQLLEREA